MVNDLIDDAELRVWSMRATTLGGRLRQALRSQPRLSLAIIPNTDPAAAAAECVAALAWG